jgi:acetyl-CoA carboxylase biotin carboxyl carrier protein
MNLDKLRKILEIVDKMNLAEIELEMEDLKLKLKKPAGLSPLQPLPTSSLSSTLSPVGQPAFPVAAPVGLQTPAEPPAEKIKIESRDKLVTVRSPIIGTFYRSPSPDADPYVKVGDMVSKGQVLCIVEAMKIMNEIESEYDGRIISILVENEQPVEYDQELFLIEPK